MGTIKNTKKNQQFFAFKNNYLSAKTLTLILIKNGLL